MGRQPWVAEEYHEIREIAVVLPELSDQEHEVHAEGVTAQRKEQTLSQT
jgi:hypothetical protein